MNARENPVTRPSVFRTQDAHGSLGGDDYAVAPSFATPYAQHVTLHAHNTAAAATTLAGRPTTLEDYATNSGRLSAQLTGIGGGVRGSPTPPGLGQQSLPRQPSIRTFSQLSAVPIAFPNTTAFFGAESALPPAWTDSNRSAPMTPAEALGNGLMVTEPLLQRPLGPDSIREAVYAYLEATDRHDVVMAMLADERRHTQRSAGTAAAAASSAAGASFSPSPSPQPPPQPYTGKMSAHLHDDHGAGRGPGETTSAPTSLSQGFSRAASPSSLSTSVPHLFSPPLETAAAGGGAALAPGTLEGKRGRQRRSHDLLRRGLLDRRAAQRQTSPDTLQRAAAGTTTSGRRPPHVSPHRGHAAAALAATEHPTRPSSPPAFDTAARGGSPHTGKATAAPPTQEQLLPKMLPTLCGLEEAVRPDLVLLFADLERKIREQYRQLSIPPPSREVLQYVLTQAHEPMWSVGEDANAYHLFKPANPVTGMVLYGTLNQMVEQLTQVYVMPLSTPPEVVLKSERAFTLAFLRRHRLLMPSHVLLAKLIERYLVPLSLYLGFERFKAHGITVHAPDMGASLPPRRSQSETVLHGRRHPGAAAAGGGGAAASASTSAPSNGESGAWGSRSARPSPPVAGVGVGSGVGGNSVLRPSANAVVEEYVRATAAATSPDAAVIAMVRSGLFPTLTSDSIAALTNAAIGTAPGSTLTSNPASTTLPHHGGLAGFPGSPVMAPGDGHRLSAFLSGGGVGGTATRPAAELVTTYSPSAALWLTVCERVQLKVLSVLLYWLRHHPHHFDGEMLRSVLHFVESCCYGTCEWADAPSRHPQVAEFIRQACHAALPLSPSMRRLGGGGSNAAATPGGMCSSQHVMGAAAQFAAFPPISREWRDGVLSGTWERRRYQLLSEAVPPSLRQSMKAELLPWTWITPMGSLTPREYLPCFAFRTLPSAGIMAYSAEELLQQQQQHNVHQQGPSRCSAVGGANSDARIAAAAGPEVSSLHAAAQEALRLFGSSTAETYVRGLTAAHYRMFTAFPSQDIFIAAQHTSSSYLSSPTFQASFLGRFLKSSAFLTSWSVSLLLHAAYLDGERAAAVVAVTNLSILNSFVGDATDYRALMSGGGGGTSDISAAAAAAAVAAAIGGGGGGGHSRSFSVSVGNASLSTASAATASVGASSQNGLAGACVHDGGGVASNMNAAPTATAASRLGSFVHNPACQFLQILDRLVDLVVGFLRVNNLHASYSIFRGFTHPFVKKLLQHRRIAANVHAQTAHRIRKLEGFFTSIPPSSPTTGGAGAETTGAGRHALSSPAVAADVGDPTVDDESDTAADGATADGAAGAPSSPTAATRHPRKTHHSFFEYLNTVPDSVEYPTVPVVQYYLRELQMMFALEPTFFTVPSHQMQSRFVSEEVRLTGVFTVPRAGLEEEQAPAAASPIAVVNWRKMHLVDDWIQRVSSNQMSCLYYISSRSTVVRHIMPDLDFEQAFDAQLSRVVVTNTTQLQEMANQLYAAL